MRQRFQTVAQRTEFRAHASEQRAEGGFAFFAFLVLFVIALVVLIVLVAVRFVGSLGERVLRGRVIERRGGFLGGGHVGRFGFRLRLNGSRRGSGLLYDRRLNGGFDGLGYIGGRLDGERLLFADGRLRPGRSASGGRFGRGLCGLRRGGRVDVGETGSLRTGLRYVRLGRRSCRALSGAAFLGHLPAKLVIIAFDVLGLFARHWLYTSFIRRFHWID